MSAPPNLPLPPTDAQRAEWLEIALETSDCPVCRKTGLELREAGTLEVEPDLRCTACNEVLDDGACDPSDDECGHCGFPTFDCKCEWDDDGDEGEESDDEW